jgi:predicted nucleotidyltransferase
MQNIISMELNENEQTNNALRAIIGIFETTFPELVRGYYVEGSYADRSEVTTSDIDLMIVFKGDMAEVNARAEALASYCCALSSVELDIGVIDEMQLTAGATPYFKMGSVLIYGEDIRDSFPLMPLIQWTRDRMHSSLWRTVHLFNRSDIIHYPLDYPDPAGEFYGYDRRKLRLRTGEEVNCTRDLIRLTGWSATALLAYRTGRYVARKSECHRAYQEYFHDEWGQLLQDIYVYCRGKWQYLLPTDLQERHKLREICERTLAFENHFLLVYKEFLLSELHAEDVEGQLYALWVLSQLVYRDDEVEEAVVRLTRCEHEKVQEAAQKALQKFPR